ncbi:hypothetical protein F4801DRAFT_597422 [Xylaria longipes]|nr:hypothetical protein F4801DRAFT_597422 [Xylaria longipes]
MGRLKVVSSQVKLGSSVNLSAPQTYQPPLQPANVAGNQYEYGHPPGPSEQKGLLVKLFRACNLNLSRLELAVIALKCLYKRKTTQYLPGDHAYALMGLLRIRPEVDITDSQFQAFARISLVNDSDRLLERYLCTMPANIDQPWHDMEDAYHSSLWEIEPYCQVAAICEDNTVIIDGARGASIRWKSFLPVAIFPATPWSYTSLEGGWRRHFAAELMHNNGTIFLIAISLIISGTTIEGVANELVAAGVFVLILSIYIWLQSPMLIRTMYGGKFTQVQAALFGFEGYINAPAIERAILGGNFGRFAWSANGSPLSCSYDWATQTMYREAVFRLPTHTLDRMNRVPRVRIGTTRPVVPLKRAVALSV